LGARNWGKEQTKGKAKGVRSVPVLWLDVREKYSPKYISVTRIFGAGKITAI
jgi:hypothetical protein